MLVHHSVCSSLLVNRVFCFYSTDVRGTTNPSLGSIEFILFVRRIVIRLISSSIHSFKFTRIGVVGTNRWIHLLNWKKVINHIRSTMTEICFIYKSHKDGEHAKVYDILEKGLCCHKNSCRHSDCPGYQRWSPLHYACSRLDEERIEQYLTTNLSRYETTDRLTELLVTKSVYHEFDKFIACFEQIKTKPGVDIHAVNSDGKNLLHQACSSYRDVDHRVIRYLLEQEIDINMKDVNGHFPLYDVTDMHTLVECMSIGKPCQEQKDKLLLTCKVIENKREEDECLHRIRYLLSIGANPLYTFEGETALSELYFTTNLPSSGFIQDVLSLFPYWAMYVLVDEEDRVRVDAKDEILPLCIVDSILNHVAYNQWFKNTDQPKVWEMICVYLRWGCPTRCSLSADLHPYLRVRMERFRLLSVLCTGWTLPRVVCKNRLPVELVRKLDGFLF